MNRALVKFKGRSKKSKKVAELPETKLGICSLQRNVSSYLLREDFVPSPDDAALPKPSICPLTDAEVQKITDDKLSNRERQRKKKLHANGLISSSVQAPSSMSLQQIPNGFVHNEKKTSNNSFIQRKPQRKEPECKNHKLTEYFPVRRSNRKTLCNLLKERQKLVEDAVLSGNEDGFEVKEFPGKGRGVVTTKRIRRGEFVLEYYGELIDIEKAKAREICYATKKNTGCYMYYFKHDNKQYCIDATEESGRLGRLVNHSKKGNLKTQPFFINNLPHLILIAGRDILPGEELLYDYGDRSKESLESYPWLAS